MDKFTIANVMQQTYSGYRIFQGDFMWSVSALIPAPIYFGKIFDMQCILWSETCDGKGSCLEYNIEDLPFVFFGVSLALKCIAYVFIALTYIAANHAAKQEVKKTVVPPQAPQVPNGPHIGYDNKVDLELETPQSDVTVSTICSSYSLQTECTRL